MERLAEYALGLALRKEASDNEGTYASTGLRVGAGLGAIVGAGSAIKDISKAKVHQSGNIVHESLSKIQAKAKYLGKPSFTKLQAGKHLAKGSILTAILWGGLGALGGSMLNKHNEPELEGGTYNNV